MAWEGHMCTEGHTGPILRRPMLDQQMEPDVSAMGMKTRPKPAMASSGSHETLVAAFRAPRGLAN